MKVVGCKYFDTRTVLGNDDISSDRENYPQITSQNYSGCLVVQKIRMDWDVLTQQVIIEQSP